MKFDRFECTGKCRLKAKRKEKIVLLFNSNITSMGTCSCLVDAMVCVRDRLRCNDASRKMKIKKQANNDETGKGAHML